jgi:hypothetical protein
MELAALEQLKQELASTPPTPVGRSEIRLFVHQDILNGLLAVADGLEMPIPERQQSFVVVDRVRLVTNNGPPLLHVEAHAEDRKHSLRLDVHVLAMLTLTPSNDPANLIASVRIQKVAPVLTWKCMKLRFFGLAGRIIDTAADQWALDHLTFPLPVQDELDLSLPAMNEEVRIPTRPDNNSYLRGMVTRDKTEYKRIINVKHTWFLKDGLHILAHVQ